MNFIDAVGTLADSAILLIRDGAALDAMTYVRNVVLSYDALAPDWDSAPEWAQWYTIDANGEAAWSKDEPTAIEHWASMWGPIAVRLHNAPIVTLPLGVDWRLCKWSREAAQ